MPGVAAHELAADREEVLAVEREEIVLDRDLGEAERRELLDLVDAERGRAVAHLAAGPRGAEQKMHSYGQPRLVTTLAWLSKAR